MRVACLPQSHRSPEGEYRSPVSASALATQRPGLFIPPGLMGKGSSSLS